MKTIGIIVVIIFGLILTKLWSQRNQSKKLLQNNTYEERLDDQLNIAKTNFSEANKNFGINFLSDNKVIFQIIKRTLLKGNQTKEFGFGIHLSFDDSFPETKEELQNFKNLEFADQFKYHSWDGIDTYQIDLKEDKEKTEELTKKIVKHVYKKDQNKIEIEIFAI